MAKAPAPARTGRPVWMGALPGTAEEAAEPAALVAEEAADARREVAEPRAPLAEERAEATAPLAEELKDISKGQWHMEESERTWQIQQRTRQKQPRRRQQSWRRRGRPRPGWRHFRREC
jgi:hypothetical protein